MNTPRDIALLALDLGLSPLPPVEDGTKRPCSPLRDENGKPTWKPYQTKAAGRQEVIDWYANGRTGVGLATGYGDLECFEFDCRATYERYKAAAITFGLGDLVERIEAGYSETTPGGGVHWLYRCEKIDGNTKLAERPKPTEAAPNGKEPLIETRGVGGFIVIAPSNGKVHPSGGRYELIGGGLGTIVTIGPDEREALFSLARSFDEIPVEPQRPPKPKGRPTQSRRDGVTPLDDFNARADHRQELEGFGWRLAHTSGSVEYWRRPGKDEGWSATWGHTKGFRVFTSSTALSQASHTLANVYCVLKHNGDWKATVKDLVHRGFGTWIDGQGEEHPNPPPPPPPKGGGTKPERRKAVEGDPGSPYILTDSGQPVRCVSNTVTWLSQNKPGWIRYDSFRRLVLLGEDAMADHVVVGLVTEIEAAFGSGWAKEHVQDALILGGHRNEFSSLVQYLESLEWDRVNRLESFFPDHYEVTDTPYHREVGRILFLSAAARGLDPGCKVDTVVLLMGDQGLHKSLGIRTLCPHDEWFTDNIGNLDGGVETVKRLAGKWMVELGELAAMRRSEIETVKNFITIQSDNYRPSYGRGNQDFPRSCIFTATTNSDHPLQDTENRRFLPVRIKNKGNLETIAAARDQLWAEAVHRYKGGEPWWMTRSNLIEDAKEEGRTARQGDAWQDVLASKLQLSDRTTMLEAAEMLGIDLDKLDRPKETRIGQALKAIGFEWRKGPRPLRIPFYERPGPTSG
jgi:hypothetical protein